MRTRICGSQSRVGQKVKLIVPPWERDMLSSEILQQVIKMYDITGRGGWREGVRE